MFPCQHNNGFDEYDPDRECPNCGAKGVKVDKWEYDEQQWEVVTCDACKKMSFPAPSSTG